MSGRRGPLAALLLAGLALAAGCASNGAAAREELRQSLLQHHAGELQRDAPAVAEKLRRMARGNFAFFRGAEALYPTAPSRFTAVVALVGDPHPENVGTFPSPDASDDELIVDFNDFDRARFGPFVEDLRRLALGLALAADAADVGKKQRQRLVEALVAGYLAELADLAAGKEPVALRADSAFGGDLAALLDEPALAVPTADPGLLNEDERAALETALVTARSTLYQPEALAPAYFRVKRAVRARGGVASFFLQRIRVVVEGAGPGADDDVSLELKETPPGSGPQLVRLQRELQERPDEDPLLAHLELGGKSFRTRSFGPETRAVSVERLAALVKGPRWGKKDLRSFGGELGRLLARGHARARGPDGKPGLGALRAALAGPDAARALASETTAVTAAAAARLGQDLDHLRALLAERGPLLGWTPP